MEEADASEDSNRISEIEAEVERLDSPEDNADQSLTPLISDIAKRSLKRKKFPTKAMNNFESPSVVNLDPVQA